jgi:hypothetical protein
MTDHCTNCFAPLRGPRWQLHDGRAMCARCHATAVYDPARAREIFAFTTAAVAAQLGMQLRVGVGFALADADALRAFQTRTSEPVELLGVYMRNGRERTIYVRYGLPLLMLRTTIAHEYAHAWQTENCPLLDDLALSEGFAEWVAYRHLLYLGAGRAADKMRAAPHPYRAWFLAILDREMRDGPAGVLAHLIAAGRGMG